MASCGWRGEAARRWLRGGRRKTGGDREGPLPDPKTTQTQQGTQGPPQSFAGGLGTRRCPHAQAPKPHFGRVDTRVTVLKCRLCPSAAFSNWEDFKRHCKYMGAHPFEIFFCDNCGDFFARCEQGGRTKEFEGGTWKVSLRKEPTRLVNGRGILHENGEGWKGFESCEGRAHEFSRENLSSVLLAAIPDTLYTQGGLFQL